MWLLYIFANERCFSVLYLRGNKMMKRKGELDTDPNILVIIAHDCDVPDVIDLYPKPLNSWKDKGWKERLRWMFLNDFQIERNKA